MLIVPNGGLESSGKCVFRDYSWPLNTRHYEVSCGGVSAFLNEERVIFSYEALVISRSIEVIESCWRGLKILTPILGWIWFKVADWLVRCVMICNEFLWDRREKNDEILSGLGAKSWKLSIIQILAAFYLYAGLLLHLVG